MEPPPTSGTGTSLEIRCSYALKTALARCAELSQQASPHLLARIELENFCRRTLGENEWNELVQTIRAWDGMVTLDRHLADWDTKRLRTLLAHCKSQKESDRAQIDQLLAGIDNYYQQLVQQRDSREVALTLRVLFYETADLVYKLRQFFTGAHSPKGTRKMLQLSERLPLSLKEDFTSAILAMAKNREARRKQQQTLVQKNL